MCKDGSLNVLERRSFAITATVERTRRPSIAKTNVSISAERAGGSTSVMKVVVYGKILPAALLISHCVRMAAT